MERDKKNYEKMDFCAQLPADLIDSPNLSLELKQAIVKIVQ